jgi:hypothetical protein
MDSSRTVSWTVVGIGVAVTGLGWSLLPSLWGAGILGFGFAHIILGLLDTRRPVVRK